MLKYAELLNLGNIDSNPKEKYNGLYTMLDPLNNLKNYLYTNINFFSIGAVVGVLLIQISFPKGTRTVSRRIFLDYYDNLYKFGLLSLPGFTLGIEAKYLKEYRCPSCYKLLAKGQLNHRSDVLEVKCRGCSTICLFKGEDAEIVEKRSALLKQGLIPDTEKNI